MKKRITMIIATLMAASMLAGCSALSAEDFKDALEDATSDYTDAVKDLGEIMGDDPEDIDKGEVKEVMDEARAALNTIKKLSAPKEIKDEFDAYCDYIDEYMLKELDLTYDYALAYIDEDDDKMEELQDEMKELLDDAAKDSDALTDLESELLELIEEEEDD